MILDAKLIVSGKLRIPFSTGISVFEKIDFEFVGKTIISLTAND